MLEVSQLPALNASLNFVASCFLLAGFVAARRSNHRLHGALMCAAFVVSTAFLASYLYYHYHVEFVTRYQGQGFDRLVYFFILLTHIPLATLMTPFCVAAMVFALFKKWAWHKRIVKWLWPVWMYVSVTGVLIYLMLYVL